MRWPAGPLQEAGPGRRVIPAPTSWGPQGRAARDQPNLRDHTDDSGKTTMQVTETLSQGLKREFQVLLAANELEERLTSDIYPADYGWAVN